MLSLNADIIDLDPCQWKKIQQILRQETKKCTGAYVLYEQSKIINIYIERNGLISTDNYDSSLPPNEIAREIFNNYPDVDKVETYELKTLISYCKSISFECDGMDADQYLRYCIDLRYSLPGIKVFYRNQPPLSPLYLYLYLMRFLEENNPYNYYFCLAIYQQNQLFLSLIIGILAGKIKLITTFEQLQTLNIKTPSFYEHNFFTSRFLKAVKCDGEVVFLTLEIFRELMKTSEKKRVFQNALTDKKILINQNSLCLTEKFIESYHAGIYIKNIPERNK